MALARRRRRYPHDAPPPSPIPTARGSRSAANHSFVQFLETAVQLPRLSLPPSHFLSSTSQPLLSDVDFRSLMIDDDYSDSVSRILYSSEKFGAFRIINHGVSLDRLSSLLIETGRVFNDELLRPDFVKSYEDREEILWFRSRTKRMRFTEKLIADESCRTFCQNMDYVGSKLDVIADRISGVISERLGEKFETEIKERESTLIVRRYYDHHSSSRGNEKEEDDALSLHIPLQRCEFRAQSEGNSVYFNADPNVVVVAIGKQLREWSEGNLKSATGEVFSEPASSTVVKLKLSLTRFKTFSTTDQILFSFMIYFLYEMFASFW